MSVLSSSGEFTERRARIQMEILRKEEAEAKARMRRQLRPINVPPIEFRRKRVPVVNQVEISEPRPDKKSDGCSLTRILARAISGSCFQRRNKPLQQPLPYSDLPLKPSSRLSSFHS